LAQPSVGAQEHQRTLPMACGTATARNLNVPKYHADLPAFTRSETEPGRPNWLSIRVFDTYAAIIAATCDAWQKPRR